MITTSDSWKKLNREFLLPETFVEISVGFADVGIQDLLEASGTNEAIFSNVGAVVGNVETSHTKYATLEHNLWVLDGSRDIAPDSGPYNSPGYANNDDTNASVTLSVSEIRSVPIPGFTITWSSEYNEYATDFTLEVKNGDTVVGSVTVNDNTSIISEVALEVVDYDSVTITVHGWNTPDRRMRLERVSFGHSVTFHKNDILSYSHEQHGCLNSGEVPKNSIDFALDNTDGKWNPYNPDGVGKYLMERQVVTVRYGMLVNSKTEWINGGKFYLSEWKAPANGLEATFVARDMFEFLLNEKPETVFSGTLTELVRSAVDDKLPLDVVVNIDPVLDNHSAECSVDNTMAEIVQKCANAACCVVFCDRDGNLNIKPLDKSMSDYQVTADLSYTHPEITLSKQLKGISVSYGEDAVYFLSVGATGEIQTVDNSFVTSETQAAGIATWVRDNLVTRKTVTGEFRADPRLDLFDIVAVESKYGIISPVAITNIKYTYSGAFRGSYTGKVISGVVSNELGAFILGQSTLG